MNLVGGIARNTQVVQRKPENLGSNNSLNVREALSDGVHQTQLLALQTAQHAQNLSPYEYARIWFVCAHSILGGGDVLPEFMPVPHFVRSAVEQLASANASKEIKATIDRLVSSLATEAKAEGSDEQYHMAYLPLLTNGEEKKVTPTVTAEPSATASSTVKPSPSATVSSTVEPSPSATASSTAEPSPSATVSSTVEPSPSATASSTVTASPSVTQTPEPVETPSTPPPIDPSSFGLHPLDSRLIALPQAAGTYTITDMIHPEGYEHPLGLNTKQVLLLSDPPHGGDIPSGRVIVVGDNVDGYPPRIVGTTVGGITFKQEGVADSSISMVAADWSTNNGSSGGAQVHVEGFTEAAVFNAGNGSSFTGVNNVTVSIPGSREVNFYNISRETFDGEILVPHPQGDETPVTDYFTAQVSHIGNGGARILMIRTGGDAGSRFVQLTFRNSGFENVEQVREFLENNLRFGAVVDATVESPIEQRVQFSMTDEVTGEETQLAVGTECFGDVCGPHNDDNPVLWRDLVNVETGEQVIRIESGINPMRDEVSLVSPAVRSAHSGAREEEATASLATRLLNWANSALNPFSGYWPFGHSPA